MFLQSSTDNSVQSNDKATNGKTVCYLCIYLCMQSAVNKMMGGSGKNVAHIEKCKSDDAESSENVSSFDYKG